MIRSFSHIPPPGYTEVAAHRKSQAESRQRPCEFSGYTWPTDGQWTVLMCFHFILWLSLHLWSHSHDSQYLRKSLKDILCWKSWREIIPGLMVVYLALLMHWNSFTQEKYRHLWTQPSHMKFYCFAPLQNEMQSYKRKGRWWHSPCIPHKHWHHSDIQMTCPDRQNRACKHEGVEAVKEGSEQVPQNWCSEFRLLQKKKEI